MLGLRSASLSTGSLPTQTFQEPTWSLPPIGKKRKRSASFAQACFRAQALDNQPLPSPFLSSHTEDLREVLFSKTKDRLIHRENWPDDSVTDGHARRLTEAMIRLGVDNLDNLITEASRINCGNMTITATLLSAVVVTLFSTTYSTNTTAGFRTANALFATSLVLSLATGVASFLAMEWLAWSSSQELRSASVLYRMMRTAVRSGLMHSAIFSFFTGLLVLLWEVTPVSVCIMPTIISISFGLYYVAATVRPIYMTGWKGTGQFDAVDVRGLRVQVWTPFSVGTQRLANYIWATVLGPLQRGIQQLSPSLRHRESTTMDIEAQVDSLAAFKITKG